MLRIGMHASVDVLQRGALGQALQVLLEGGAMGLQLGQSTAGLCGDARKRFEGLESLENGHQRLRKIIIFFFRIKGLGINNIIHLDLFNNTIRTISC